MKTFQESTFCVALLGKVVATAIVTRWPSVVGWLEDHAADIDWLDSSNVIHQRSKWHNITSQCIVTPPPGMNDLRLAIGEKVEGYSVSICRVIDESDIEKTVSRAEHSLAHKIAVAVASHTGTKQ